MKTSVTVLVLAALVGGAGCDSHADDVCQDIGDCAHHGDNDWIGACQDEAKALGMETSQNGCGPAFGAYYQCADDSYTCTAATATFPGCDDELAALDACLGQATAGTACARLTMAERTCGSAPSSTTPDGGPPPACTAARDCQARCYLDTVANVCAPRVDELEAVTSCAASCPP